MASEAIEIIGFGVTNLMKIYSHVGQSNDLEKEVRDMFKNMRLNGIRMITSKGGRKEKNIEAVALYSDSTSLHHDELAVKIDLLSTSMTTLWQLFAELTYGLWLML